MMDLSFWRRMLQQIGSPRPKGAVRRPTLEALEDRLVLSSNTDFVQALYQQVLHRTGSQAEVDSYVNLLSQGTSRDQVAQVFVTSPERHDRDVAGLYQEILLRNSTPQERAGWVASLAGGMSLKDVARQFLLSPEYQQAHPGDDGFVRGLYADLLRRTPDDREVAGWTNQLAAGAPRDAIAQGFLGAREREHIEVGNLAAELLQRNGSVAEQDGWSTYLDQHGGRLEEVARLFVTSPEFEAEIANEVTGGPAPPGSPLPGVLRLDDTVTLPLPTGPLTVREFAELFSGYPIPSAGGPALVDQLLATQAASTPTTTTPTSLGVVPMYVAYSGPTPSNLPADPILITAINSTGTTVTMAVNLVPGL
jgi:hypothetical protein